MNDPLFALESGGILLDSTFRRNGVIGFLGFVFV